MEFNMSFFKQKMFWIDTIIPTIIGVFLFFFLPHIKNPTWEQALDPARVILVFLTCLTISIIRYKFFKKNTSNKNTPTK